jgi:hypothetical protein
MWLTVHHRCGAPSALRSAGSGMGLDQLPGAVC